MDAAGFRHPHPYLHVREYASFPSALCTSRSSGARLSREVESAASCRSETVFTADTDLHLTVRCKLPRFQLPVPLGDLARHPALPPRGYSAVLVQNDPLLPPPPSAPSPKKRPTLSADGVTDARFNRFV